jgi:hypothetical protein
MKILAAALFRLPRNSTGGINKTNGQAFQRLVSSLIMVTEVADGAWGAEAAEPALSLPE